MPDPRFFLARGPVTVAELGSHSGASVAGDGARRISGVAPLGKASSDDLSFYDNARYVADLAASKAGAVVIEPRHRHLAPEGATLLLALNVPRAYALASAVLYPEPEPLPGISPYAVISSGARVGADCTVEAGAVIATNAEVGRGSVVGVGVSIAGGVVVGENCRIGAGARLSHCILGARVNVYPGACIGQDGFGFAPDSTGHVRVPQLGRVIVHDGVEIGANTTIDRGSVADTIIGAGCWIDNLVHIGHNVQLGRGCIIAGQCGIAGSTVLGDFVAMGGQVGIAGHLHIGAGARIAGHSGVIRDVAPGETVGGFPAVPVRSWHRQTAALERLAKVARGGAAAGEEP